MNVRLGAALWIACLQYFVAEAVTIFGWPGPYSLSRNYISDLGAVGCDVRASGLEGSTEALCSPLHQVMNASFLLQGVLIVSGAALLSPRLAKSALTSIALLLIAASGIGVFIVGLAPEDVMPKLHYFGALENFLCCNAGMAMMGLGMLRRGNARPALGLTSLGAGSIGLLGIGFLGMKTYLGLGVGGMERVVAYPFPLWMAGMGLLILRSGESAGGALAKDADTKR